MKPRYNPWPLCIISAFIIFFAGTLSLVFVACSQKMDLVSQDYYEREIKFQSHIDRLHRTQFFGVKASIEYDPTAGIIIVHLPAEHAPRISQGRIEFYRPSSATLDRQLLLKLNAAGTQSIATKNLAPGLWNVRVSWTADEKDFFIDQKLVVESTPNRRTTAG